MTNKLNNVHGYIGAVHISEPRSNEEDRANDPKMSHAIFSYTVWLVYSNEVRKNKNIYIQVNIYFSLII